MFPKEVFCNNQIQWEYTHKHYSAVKKYIFGALSYRMNSKFQRIISNQIIMFKDSMEPIQNRTIVDEKFSVTIRSNSITITHNYNTVKKHICRLSYRIANSARSYTIRFTIIMFKKLVEPDQL